MSPSKHNSPHISYLKTANFATNIHDGRNAGTKSYIWVRSTSELAEYSPAVVFCYELTRGTDHLRKFYKDYNIEYTNRKNNRLKRLIRQAELEQPDASIAAIDYQSGRKLNKALISRLATCEYITEYRNIFITGATGSGKTYMACAFGMEACKHYYTVKYVRLPDLLLDLQAARDDGNFANTLKKYTKPVLLIIDEWLLLKLTESEARNPFELIHKRRKKSSTIFCSQFRESE